MRDGMGKHGPDKPRKPEDKSDRLAAALRSNLARRKARTRALAAEKRAEREQGRDR